jgi:gamma-glutamylcyclotransferase (GGCT)/AIG2-like uncharacterized protein YtfP
MSRLFVYGTLKQGYHANDKLKRHDAVFLGEAVTDVRYSLYQINWFPGMVEQESTGGVKGELYEVTNECLDELDMYEGAPSLFRREEITLSDGTQAIGYLYNSTPPADQLLEAGEFE